MATGTLAHLDHLDRTDVTPIIDFESFAVGDLVTGLASRQAGVVLANIQADVLMRFANELVGAVAPGGTLILSGILAHENEVVRAAFSRAAPGWTMDFRLLGEWSDVCLLPPAH